MKGQQLLAQPLHLGVFLLRQALRLFFQCQKFKPIQLMLTRVGGRSRAREISKHKIDVISRPLRLVVIVHLLLQMNDALFDPHPTTCVRCDRGRGSGPVRGAVGGSRGRA